MNKLTSDMKEMLKNQLSFLSTTDGDNNPQIGPKGSMRILDDQHLLYDEHTGKQAWKNVQTNPKVAVAVVDHDAYKGFRFEGIAEIHQDDQIFKDAEEFAAGNHLPHPVAAVVIKIERIFYLDAGPKAGEPVE
ncbi:pyridoxamine 5'-phosphate oxidase family protein [Xylocopilactobacillus apicola]|uniref:Sugar ABC transporter substrate-binding protein n=1 Tax=Xylocopilactobacillus apicola TaxID=2932184 RepID=A0AAU9D8Z2_9LACO|nr:pyridoxamine 5'-phosphate oxidase family protein [Xylocopilactobacillus apicola]BDR58871.1 sugar ABC transporter substrate-binding protein [Xylocopilactobacillus apicola]